MHKSTRHGPWGNPHLKDGIYSAIVTQVSYIQNEDDNSAMLELSFKLEDGGMDVVSRVYLPRTFSSQSQHRLWYLCQALQVEAYQLIEEPAALIGRKLALEITTIYPTTANHGQPYCDVAAFLLFAEPEKECEECAKKVM